MPDHMAMFSNRSQEHQWTQQLKWFNPMKLPQSTFVKLHGLIEQMICPLFLSIGYSMASI